MKIAIDIRDADGEKAGKGFLTFGLVGEMLAQDRHNQYILYSHQPKSPFPSYDNVEFRQIGGNGLKWHWNVLKDLKLLRPDLYLAPTSYIIPSLAPRWLKIMPVVHDAVAFLFPKNHSKKAVLIEKVTLRLTLKKSARILVVSENTQNDIIRLFNRPKSLFVEVPCAPHHIYTREIVPANTAKVIKKYQLPEKFILGVGTLEPRKNFAALIKSFVIVKRKFPEYKLVIVGKNGWQWQNLHRLVQEYKLGEDVIFTGYVGDQDLHHIYNAAEVFVFPSLYEGFGIPPLEAMSSGCPVIASNVSAMPEVIGDAGLLIDPKNSPKIADAIISLIENPQLRNTLLEKGFHHARKFNWQRSAAIVLDTIASLESELQATPISTAENPPPSPLLESQPVEPESQYRPELPPLTTIAEDNTPPDVSIAKSGKTKSVKKSRKSKKAKSS